MIIIWELEHEVAVTPMVEALDQKRVFFFQPHFTDNKYDSKTAILKIVFLSASTQYKKCYLFLDPKW